MVLAVIVRLPADAVVRVARRHGRNFVEDQLAVVVRVLGQPFKEQVLREDVLEASVILIEDSAGDC